MAIIPPVAAWVIKIEFEFEFEFGVRSQKPCRVHQSAVAELAGFNSELRTGRTPNLKGSELDGWSPLLAESGTLPTTPLSPPFGREPTDAALTFLLALVCLPTMHAEDWPQLRGPAGDGHYTGRPLPTEWGTDTNVTWKTEIPGRGWSSPVVCKGRVFLTSAVGTDTKPKSDQSLRAICLDGKKGEILWRRGTVQPGG